MSGKSSVIGVSTHMNENIKQENWKTYLSQLWTVIKDALLNKSKKVIKDYFESSSINCYQYIVDNTMQKWERHMWRLVHVAALASAIWVMWMAGGDAILKPVAISRTPLEATVSNVPFPGIAICSLNRISKKRASDLAHMLIETKSLNQTYDEVFGLLGYLGLSYDLEIPDSDQLEKLHDILYPYNLNVLMKNLTPTCNEIVKRCVWRNKIDNCNKLMLFRKTMDGYCCAFNYLRPLDAFGRSISTATPENATQIWALPGQSRGLSLLLDPMLEDYLFTKLPHEGFKLLFFSPEEYPDIGSGGCFQAILPPKNELYVDLDAVWITGTPEVANVPVKSRGCILKSDVTNDLSQSDCVVNCRINSMRASCKCVPFFYPLETTDNICTLVDNVCLKRWKDNWLEAWSGEETLLQPGEEAGEITSPPCNECIPECEETTYRGRQHAVVLQPDNVNLQPDSERSIFKRGVYFKNHSLVHIFFSKDTVVHLEYGILSNWYDLLCSMGGICGLVLGASVISIVEVLYYFLGGPVSKSNSRRQAEMRQLYWQELKHYRKK